MKIAGIGELLWDCFPSGRTPGGAPVNFAHHCAQLGADAVGVSRIGTDVLGDDLLDYLSEQAVDTQSIQRDADRPTGQVRVTLSDAGVPSYCIESPAAWDAIELTADLRRMAPELDAICYGTLSQRCDRSQRTIFKFLQLMKSDALKLCDINLRAPHDDAAVILRSIEHCNVLKLSDEELPVLAKQFALEGTDDEQLIELLKRFNLNVIAYTMGAQGSRLLSATETQVCAVPKVEVVSTVGAGDSFTATLCVGLLRGLPMDQVNEWANRVAAYVCTQTGAMPVLPTELTKGITNA